MSAAKKARRRSSTGFTLVEVLVALLVMAILAGLAWQALDGVLRARDDSQARVDRTVRLATVLTQWEQDLLAVHDTEAVPPLAFDGQTLRLTRRSEGGVQLVAWAVRNNQWQRWAGPALVSTGELQEAWLRSQQLLGTEPGTVLLAEDASQWQIYFARDGQWSNSQSTGNLVAAPLAATLAAPPPAAPQSAPSTNPNGGGSTPPPTPAPSTAAPMPLREALPEAVRLQVTLGGHVLTRDIALGPAGS
jgi:general secretion pathway protein J